MQTFLPKTYSVPEIAQDVEDVAEYPQRVWDLILHEETNLVPDNFQN